MANKLGIEESMFIESLDVESFLKLRDSLNRCYDNRLENISEEILKLIETRNMSNRLRNKLTTLYEMIQLGEWTHDVEGYLCLKDIPEYKFLHLNNFGKKSIDELYDILNFDI